MPRLRRDTRAHFTYARIPAHGRAGRFRVTRPAARRRLSRETPTEPLCLSVELEGVNSPLKLDAGYYATPRDFSPGGACAIQDTFAPGYATHPRPYCNYPPAIADLKLPPPSPL